MDAHRKCARRMDARLWSMLPIEIYEVVLSFLPALRLSLPVPHLCRCRAACRCWGTLLSRPYFHDLHRRNGRAGTCGYIVGRLVETPGFQATYLTGWSILDVEAERWYTFKHGEGRLLAERKHYVHGFVAADGGLVCECVSPWGSARNGFEPAVITAYNPLARTGCTTLPAIPDYLVAGDPDPRYRVVTFDVNELDNSFKVFVINEGIRPRDFGVSGDRTVVMTIYDSTTGRWRKAANPGFQDFVERGVGYGGSSVMYRGLLYVVFVPFRRWLGIPIRLGWLFTYNIVDDVWNDTGVLMDRLFVKYARAQLVVSDDRLFLVCSDPVFCEASNSSFSLFCLYEVLIEGEVLVEVFQTTIPHVLRHLNVDMGESSWDFGWDGQSIVVFGLKKSICVLSERIGTPIVYNLESGSWSRLPPNPLHPLAPGCEVWYGKTMSLHLPTEEEEAGISPLERA